MGCLRDGGTGAMTSNSSYQLPDVMSSPEKILQLDNKQLSCLISQARISRVLASLGFNLQAESLLEKLKPEARRHFESAMLVHQKQMRDLSYDCESIVAALKTVDCKLVIMKGGAYLMTGFSWAQGRLITDIDIIVPQQVLAQAENALNDAGWKTSKLDPYNESYYRKWSHETPALMNLRRGTTLDLHHNILPPTAGPTIDAADLLQNISEVQPNIYTFAPEDMVLHSAAHLFHEGEFHHGLRDLWDLDRMLRHFSRENPGFWPLLIERAQHLELGNSLLHALNHTSSTFNTPVPDEAFDRLLTKSQVLRRPLMNFLFRRAFRPNHPQSQLPLTGLALNLLFIRSHYLRMPMYLLVPHLIKKAWMQHLAKKEKKQEVLGAAKEGGGNNI
jgi:Uncharacterised nucleotidyltransferase